MRRITCALAVAVIAIAARADEEKVPLDKLPAPVTAAVKKRFPKAELVGASKESEDGKTHYEVTVKDGGKKIDVTLTPEGVITLLEKEIGVEALPKPVAEAMKAKYPKATVKVAEEIIGVKDGKETLMYYEVQLVTAEMKTIEVEFAPDGKIKKTEEKVKAGDKKN
jgi:hypothetical protein